MTWNVGGAPGLPGAAGPAGSSGPTGSTGSQGPAGPRGQAGPQGSTGAQGPAGPQGAAGPEGPTGPEGAQGAQGAKGLNWQGAWSPLSQYFTDDAVFNQGSAYLALNASFGDEPPSSNWSLLAQQGATGATGAQGPAGPAGPQGPQGPDGAQGPAGPEGPAGAQGSTGAQGPEGPQGPAGAQGVTGPRGPTIFTGRANLYSGSTMFAPVTGIAQVTATESDVETLSPNANLTAQDLSVRTSAAPGVGNSVIVRLRDDGADTAVTCTVSGTNTTCTSSSSATIAAGSKMSVKLTSTGVIAGLSILFGWQAA